MCPVSLGMLLEGEVALVDAHGGGLEAEGGVMVRVMMVRSKGCCVDEAVVARGVGKVLRVGAVGRDGLRVWVLLLQVPERINPARVDAIVVVLLSVDSLHWVDTDVRRGDGRG